jgi:hypothetical protein
LGLIEKEGLCQTVPRSVRVGVNKGMQLCAKKLRFKEL